MPWNPYVGVAARGSQDRERVDLTERTTDSGAEQLRRNKTEKPTLYREETRRRESLQELAMSGVITSADVLLNFRLIWREFGSRCLIRCLAAVALLQQRTFLQVAFASSAPTLKSDSPPYQAAKDRSFRCPLTGVK